MWHYVDEYTNFLKGARVRQVCRSSPPGKLMRLCNSKEQRMEMLQQFYGDFFLWGQYHFSQVGIEIIWQVGNLRMSIHRGDTIGECLAPRISPPEIVQEYKIKMKMWKNINTKV